MKRDRRVRRLAALLAILAGTVASGAWADGPTTAESEPQVAETEPQVTETGAAATEPEPACTWCDWVRAPGTKLIQNKDSWFINSFRFMGRFQYQTAYVDGSDVNGDNFDASFSDFRRVRFGAEVGFLRYLKVKGNANFVADFKQVGGKTDWGYTFMDELYGSFDIGRATGWEAVDKLSFHYGRRKMLLGAEVHQSSKKIKTVERSAIANRAFPTRMTGAWFKAAKGKWSGTAGIFTTELSKDIADWNGGEAYYLNVNHQLTEQDELIFDFLYNDANGRDEDNNVLTNQAGVLYKWAFSAAWEGQRGKWGLLANAIFGDNGKNPLDIRDREGLFWGFVVLPTYELPYNFELVGRYAYQGSKRDAGIRTNSRYFRRELKTEADVNGGRGDNHHSLYAGLNYYFCDDNMKIMSAVEWETLDTPDGNANGWTLWLAYRMYF